MSKRTAGDDSKTARAVAEAMIGKCGLSQSLGMKIIDAGPKYSVVEMVLEDRHLNGFSIAHGGAVFALADTAFAHACNSDNVVTVAQQCQINFLQPGRRRNRGVSWYVVQASGPGDSRLWLTLQYRRLNAKTRTGRDHNA